MPDNEPEDRSPKGLKYTGTKIDIVNDFSDEVERLKIKYADKPDALSALDEIEDITIWWANAPTLWEP